MYIFASDASEVLLTVAQQHVVIVTQYLYQYVRGLDGEHVTWLCVSGGPPNKIIPISHSPLIN